MITYLRANLLEDDAQALVNTVNTVGVMGKGIALQFKQRFPANFVAYAQACKLGQVQTGRMFVTEPGELTGPRWVVNFPTKQHWRDPSRMEWVVDGLPWAAVRGHIEAALGDLPVEVRVYVPL